MIISQGFFLNEEDQLLFPGRVGAPASSLVCGGGCSGAGGRAWVAVAARGWRPDVRVVRRVDARRRVGVVVRGLRCVAAAARVPARVAVPQVPVVRRKTLRKPKKPKSTVGLGST